MTDHEKERIRAHEDAVRERDEMLHSSMQEGITKGRAEDIVNIMRKLNYNLTSSMELFGIPQSEY